MSEHGKLIRRTRERKGLSQDALGRLIGKTGSHIARIELGGQRGSLNVLITIAKALNLDPELIIRKAGFEDIKFAPSKPLELDIETLEFINLDANVKKFLLELAPIVTQYMVGLTPKKRD